MGLDNGSDIYTLTEEIGIPPQSTGILTLRFKEGAELGIHELHLPIVVLNFLKNPKESLRSIFKIKVENRTFARSNG
jgi:hypothetical protein